MDAGSLDILLPSVGRFPEPIIIQIAHAIVQGLLYLWQQLHIVHRQPLYGRGPPSGLLTIHLNIQ
ncbi:unnamed protein product [Echinostoma caproni]|uniref:Protein kinase domain-containing protein n=1 Tax=Echinostoma caproni TaxID=27848 RepID=A0A183BGQ5_9TREM|nr:unnamed protein product [Echinostoma caproni]